MASTPPPSSSETTNAAPAASEAVTGRVVLADGLSQGEGTLFVILRMSGVSAGPPRRGTENQIAYFSPGLFGHLGQ